MPNEPRSARPWLRPALLAVAGLWVALRIAVPALPMPEAAARAVDSIEVRPSPESGRLEIYGWPDDVAELGLPRIPDVSAAAVRLDRSVDAANAALARRSAEATSRIEIFPDDLAGLHVAGLLVAFPASDTAELADLAGADPGRPVETLTRLGRILEVRLEEPPDAIRMEDSVQRRELLRLQRDLRGALDEKQGECDAAVSVFRDESRAAIRAAAGPFLRRGRGLALETVLAALLGALLREALRRRPAATRPDPAITVAVAPVVALAAVIALGGTRWLPSHPLFGLTPAFVALAFVLGWLTPGWLGVLARLDRPDSDPPPPSGTPGDAASDRPSLARSAAPPARLTLPPGERPPPFFPRRR